MARPGNPGRTPDNKYHIANWQAYVDANFATLPRIVKGSDKDKLSVERLRLQNEKLEFELKVMRKDYSSNVEIEQWVGDLVMQAKRVLLQIPSKLAPQIISLNEVEAEKRMREEINAALELLTSRPLGS